MSCASEAEILELALRSGSATSNSAARHVRTCEPCSARIADIRRVIRGIEPSALDRSVAGDECLDEIALAEFAQGRSDADHRTGRIGHLAVCAHCRGELASIADVLGDPHVVAEIQGGTKASSRTGSRSRWFGIVGLAAAASIVAIAWPRNASRSSQQPHRAPTITATAAPAAISPSGDVGTVGTLQWAAVPGADGYRVTVFEAGGRVMYQTQIVGTVVALPDSVVIVPHRSYLWKVEARTEFERWTSSELTEFRVDRGRPQ
jgi:hypothetical protein